MTPQGFDPLDATTLATWLDGHDSVTLFDIRDPLSFAQAHIPGSRHLDNASVGALLDETPHDRPLVVVCYHGHSSQQAASWLAGQGYRQVYSLDGGFTDWQVKHPSRVASSTGHD